MFIVWGNKRTERKLGFVADFCPLCRAVRAFKIIRVGSTSHVYYISFGSGKLLGYIIECAECKQTLSTDAMRYSAFEKLPSMDLDALVQITFPNLDTIYAERLAIESKIKQYPDLLTPEERIDLIVEPFQLLNPIVEERFTRDTQLDKKSGTGCLGSLVILVVLLTIACNLSEPLQGKVLLAAFCLFGLGTIYTFVQLGLGPGRFLRTKIVSSLALTLSPLRPTKEEISACLAKCKAAQMKIGQKLKTEVLWSELEKKAESVPEDRFSK